MSPTPSTEKTVYFDAPLAHFHMASLSSGTQNLTNAEAETAAVQLHPEVQTGAINDEAPVLKSEEPHPINTNELLTTLPAVDAPPLAEEKPKRSRSVLKKKRRSKDSPRPSESSERHSGNGHQRAASVGAASAGRRSLTDREGNAVDGAAFINGAGTTGPNATPQVDESLHFRAASADVSLTPKQRSNIVKSEVKDNKRLSKIIKQEARVEKAALSVAISELAELQKIQKSAIKREAQVHTSYSKALANFQKLEASYLDARTKYEAAQAQLNAESEALAVSRTGAREATERMQEKSQEIESLRLMLGVDQREREIKLAELSMKKNGHPGSKSASGRHTKYLTTHERTIYFSSGSSQCIASEQRVQEGRNSPEITRRSSVNTIARQAMERAEAGRGHRRTSSGDVKTIAGQPSENRMTLSPTLSPREGSASPTGSGAGNTSPTSSYLGSPNSLTVRNPTKPRAFTFEQPASPQLGLQTQDNAGSPTLAAPMGRSRSITVGHAPPPGMVMKKNATCGLLPTPPAKMGSSGFVTSPPMTRNPTIISGVDLSEAADGIPRRLMSSEGQETMLAVSPRPLPEPQLMKPSGSKVECKDEQRLSRIIRNETKVDKAKLSMAITELAERQRIHKNAMKLEAKAHSAYSDAISAFQKLEIAYLTTRTRYEGAQAQLNSDAEALERYRNNTKMSLEGMQEKSHEIDYLRSMLDVDEREREIKLSSLGSKKSFWS